MEVMTTTFIIQTGTRIHPFGDHAGAAWIGGRPLKDLQDEEVARAGMRAIHLTSPADLPEHGPCVVAPDYLYASASCLSEFASAARTAPGVAHLCMPVSPVTEYTRPLSGARGCAVPGGGEVTPSRQKSLDTVGGDGVAYDLYHLDGAIPGRGRDATAFFAGLAASAAPAVVHPGYSVRRIRRPAVGPKPHFTELPVTDTLAAHVRSWVHVLWLNHILTAVRLRYSLAAQVGLAERARRAAVALNVPGCIANSVVGGSLDAHPTARIENSVVGSGARIGARAILKDCIVGDDVVVGDRTRFVNCVVGDRCNSLSDSFFAHDTFYPDATLSNVLMQHCVAGRFAFVTTAVLCYTDGIEGPVRVYHDGEMHDTGRWVLGAALGHETTLGTRAIFMPGLALPNGCIVVMPPGEGLHKVPATAGGGGAPHVWDKGSLRPIAEVFPGYRPGDADVND